MRSRPLLALLAVAAVLAASCEVGTITREGPAQPARNVVLDQSAERPPASPLAEVVDRALPSLVNVRVVALVDDPLGGIRQTEGQGSGVIVDEAGIVVTNNHVISGAVNVEVAFTDDRDPVEGIVIGRVPERDLAVIEVEADDLTAIEIGRSSELRLGDSVIALGFPLGLGGPTVTAGILSGRERTIEPEGGPRLEGLLQTDAAINPGNSGGPLVDGNGRLIGINTATARGIAENVGFAIAIDHALPVIEQILSDAPEQRAWLGVLLAPVDSTAAATSLGLDPSVRGVLIQELVEGAPAEDAGLRPGDVIVAIEGDDIRSLEDLTRVLTRYEPGETIEVSVVAADGDRTVQVTLEQRPVAEAQD